MLRPNNAWECELDREFKRLPRLAAPPSLIPAVMARLGQGARAPWYLTPWQSWPAAGQAVSFALLLAMFAGLCLAASTLARSAAIHAATEQLQPFVATACLAWKTITVLASTTLLTLKTISPAAITVCLVIATLAYVACVGLGTAVARFALVRR